MHVEVSVALNFIISYLYNKLPRRRVDMFGEELERGLKRKFDGHWYPEKPFKGSAFRSMRVTGESMDPVMVDSATASGVDIDEIKDYLPKDLTVWIDPREVSYRIGEKGAVKILYSDKQHQYQQQHQQREEEYLDTTDREVQNASRGFNPEAQSFRPIVDSLPSVGNLSLSPSPSGWLQQQPQQMPTPGMVSTSPTLAAAVTAAAPGGTPAPVGTPAPGGPASTSPVASYINRNTKETKFTAAMFAQTKFGSTKLKTQAKRPTRLSPTELGAYLKQRSAFPPPPPQPGMAAGTGGSPTAPGCGGWPSPGAVSPVHGPPGGGGRLVPLSPHHVRQQDFLERQQQRLVYIQQQQPQQQGSPRHPQSPQRQAVHHLHQQFLSPTTGPLSPVGGPLGEAYLLQKSSPGVSPVGTPSGMGAAPPGMTPSSGEQHMLASPSPTDGGKTFVDTLSWNPLPAQYANLPHLLVAN